MSVPSIPPRPVRASKVPQSSHTEIPQIPPRPRKNQEHSGSPNRDTFARSPFHDPDFLKPGANGSPQKSHLSSSNLPDRPPSVSLPSIGDEGNEYANMMHAEEADSSDAPTQSKAVAGDLPMHAPKASLPVSSAKARIAAVTRTDSDFAAQSGIGKSRRESEGQEAAKLPDLTHTRSSSSSGNRPRSILNQEHEPETGIPEIGLQVPMYPNAGDVQAPTPSPFQTAPATGVGFFNNGADHSQRPRHHGRTKSGREVFHGPPGSYGLHGHGSTPKDPFERAWYDKHPTELEKEMQGEYGPAIPTDRKDWAYSSEDLNKIVYGTANKGIGLGTSHEAIGTPDEQIGYMASEEYANRISSPRPPPSHVGKPRASSSQTHAESPLRKMSFPINELNDSAEDTIHIDPAMARVTSRPGGAGYDPPTQIYGAYGASTTSLGDFTDDDGYDTPILAADEVARHPEGAYLQPAIHPDQDRRASAFYESEGQTPFDPSRRRSTSRPSSKAGQNLSTQSLSRYASHDDHGASTPLDNVKEYDPLFPPSDDEGKTKNKTEKPKTAADKLKRPDLDRHRFPSQDIWEDSPSSVMLSATVETPEPQSAVADKPAAGFERPEAEAARKDVEPEDQESFLSDHTKRFAKSKFNKDVLGDMTTRPGTIHRFPSHDIWEDTPEHHQLSNTTTIEPADESSPVESKDAQPTIPARPLKTDASQPLVPSRPVKSRETVTDGAADSTTQPSIPDRPKPKVPARPSKPTHRPSQEEGMPLAKSISAGSVDSGATTTPPLPKAKPAVPSRPAGSKIAALQSGFMKDLNSKLGLGPQQPKQPEPVEEVKEQKTPLADARKGRARGPQRRRPGALAGDKSPEKEQSSGLALCEPWTMWSISEEGDVQVPA
ncbi:hypothetical protein K402DRAFT_365907, partial [Aulographum hederae CBS 113979]